MFYLNWRQNGVLLRGFDLSTQAYVDGSDVFPVSFPDQTTPALSVTLSSSARDSGTFENLTGVSFYLTGDPDDVATIMTVWPFYGLDRDNPGAPQPRPELNGGLEISFDFGRTWNRFQYNLNFIEDGNNQGWHADLSSWLVLPQIAVGSSGQDGVLGPFDQASLMLRYVIPPSASDYKTLDIRLAVDFDIV